MINQPIPYFLGLPVWGHTNWKDRFFSTIPSQLASYAQVFNCVEGNTTFYRIPDANTVARWQADVSGSYFKFCLKIPRSITHETPSNWNDLKQFFHVVAPLGENLGPFLLQLPAHVSPNDLPRLSRLLMQLPSEYQYAIEVRHLEFFKRPYLLEPTIEKFNLGRVIFDSRPIFTGDLSHPEVLNAKHKKPNLPVVTQVYNDIVMVRLVLHPDPKFNQRYIKEWIKFTAHHIQSNHRVFMMVHCANNDHSPQYALDFHQSLMQQPELENAIAPLADWPIPQQGMLF